MELKEFKSIANQMGHSGIPFLFLLDFELQKPFICRTDLARNSGFYFEIRGENTNAAQQTIIGKKCKIKIFPIAKEIYKEAFDLVIRQIQLGNTYLLNLTFPTRLETNLSLEWIFQNSAAPYKLYRENEFVLFSPECFIRTKDNFIFSYPMKGTIDATIAGAEQNILKDEKEQWEHNTIVDLIRNDLAMTAQNVIVKKFRYIDRIKTNRNELLQVSSEIQGELPRNWKSQIGTILVKMLPAGSVSGAPKKKTVQIIRAAEKANRGYFTGVFGIFDGKNIDSAVNIRYIEKTANMLQYRSGGGITAMSQPDLEYQELLDKVYVPII